MTEFFVFLMTALISLSAFAASYTGDDLLIRTRTTSSNTTGGETTTGRTHWLTVYVKGDRQRREELWEAMGPAPRSSNVFLFQCDMKRTVSLNEDARTYTTQPVVDRGEYTKKRESDLKSGNVKPLAIDPTAGVVAVHVETIDTGERKDVSGLTARHIKETVTQEVSQGSPIRGSSRVERDGWYVDIPYGCQTGQVSAIAIGFARPAGVGHPKLDFKRTGSTAPVHGIMLMGTTIDTTPTGSTTETVELIEISHSRVDPALFEIPNNYRPALRLPNGGFDLKQPDTFLNRVIAWWKRLLEGSGI